MSKKQGITITLISMMALCLSIVSLLTVLRLSSKEARDIQYQYVIYLGTNNKDTNKAIFSPDEAKVQADGILTKHFSGFTIQEATGAWTGDNGVVAYEHTLVIFLSDTMLDKVHAAADELIRKFNRSSVLIQTNVTKTEFYSSRTKIN